MADVNNPRKGDTFYFYRTRCTVIGTTLKPGGVNAGEALVQIETAAGTPYMFFYNQSARYLSEKAVSIFKKWPLTPDSSR